MSLLATGGSRIGIGVDVGLLLLRLRLLLLLLLLLLHCHHLLDLSLKVESSVVTGSSTGTVGSRDCCSLWLLLLHHHLLRRWLLTCGTAGPHRLLKGKLEGRIVTAGTGRGIRRWHR